jgi:hypothetical protein
MVAGALQSVWITWSLERGFFDSCSDSMVPSRPGARWLLLAGGCGFLGYWCTVFLRRASAATPYQLLSDFTSDIHVNIARNILVPHGMALSNCCVVMDHFDIRSRLHDAMMLLIENF